MKLFFQDRDAADSPLAAQLRIDWVPYIAASPVNEYATGPTLGAMVDTTSGIVGRKLKHFSGYMVRLLHGLVRAHEVGRRAAPALARSLRGEREGEQTQAAGSGQVPGPVGRLGVWVRCGPTRRRREPVAHQDGAQPSGNPSPRTPRTTDTTSGRCRSCWAMRT